MCSRSVGRPTHNTTKTKLYGHGGVCLSLRKRVKIVTAAAINSKNTQKEENSFIINKVELLN